MQLALNVGPCLTHLFAGHPERNNCLILFIKNLQSLFGILCNTGLKCSRDHGRHVFTGYCVLEHSILNACKNLLCLIRILPEFCPLVFEAHCLLDRSSNRCNSSRPHSQESGRARRLCFAGLVLNALSFAQTLVDLRELCLRCTGTVCRFRQLILSFDERLHVRARRAHLRVKFAKRGTVTVQNGSGFFESLFCLFRLHGKLRALLRCRLEFGL